MILIYIEIGQVINIKFVKNPLNIDFFLQNIISQWNSQWNRENIFQKVFKKLL